MDLEGLGWQGVDWIYLARVWTNGGLLRTQ
jgi:hypothetical protein